MKSITGMITVLLFAVVLAACSPPSAGAEIAPADVNPPTSTHQPSQTATVTQTATPAPTDTPTPTPSPKNGYGGELTAEQLEALENGVCDPQFKGLEAYWNYWQSAVTPPFDVDIDLGEPVVYFDSDNPANGCGAALQLPDGVNLAALPLYKGEPILLPPQASLDGKGNIPPNQKPLEISPSGQWEGGENYQLGFSDGIWVRLDDRGDVSGVIDKNGRWRKLITVLLERTNESYDERHIVGYKGDPFGENTQGQGMRLGMNVEKAYLEYYPKKDLDRFGTDTSGETLLWVEASMPVGGIRQKFKLLVTREGEGIFGGATYDNGAYFRGSLTYSQLLTGLKPGAFIEWDGFWYIFPGNLVISSQTGRHISLMNAASMGSVFNKTHEEEIADIRQKIVDDMPLDPGEIPELGTLEIQLFTNDIPFPSR